VRSFGRNGGSGWWFQRQAMAGATAGPSVSRLHKVL
jgi:hypothetical protein